MIIITFIITYLGFLFCLQLSGAAILCVGVWMVVDPNIVNRFEITIDTEDPYFRTSSYILIAFGVFVFLVGFCGCCGAIRKSRCLLGFVSIMEIFFINFFSRKRASLQTRKSSDIIFYSNNRSSFKESMVTPTTLFAGGYVPRPIADP